MNTYHATGLGHWQNLALPRPSRNPSLILSKATNSASKLPLAKHQKIDHLGIAILWGNHSIKVCAY